FACAEQGSRRRTERKQLPILIDEYQVLRGVDWSMLAEIRKYGAAFALATQSLEYLREQDTLIQPTVLANVTQLFAFHTSARDAQTLARELEVAPEDLLSLPRYQCYARLTVHEQRHPTFSL